MILFRSLDPAALTHDRLYFFLPFAAALLFTASVLAVQWFIGLFSDRDKSFQQDHSISQGASR